jgi:hypothetical protein
MTEVIDSPAEARTATSFAVRCPGKNGEPAFVLAENQGQARELAKAYRSFYGFWSRGMGVAVVRVRIVELEEQA